MKDQDAFERELKSQCPTLELRRNELLSRHTSFRVGGPAALMALPRNDEEAIQAIGAARKLGVEPFYLGNGSNLLAADEGYDGFVVKTFPGLSDCSLQDGKVTARAGMMLSTLASFVRDWSLSGLEFAHGIPGTLGGAVTMNAGAYGGEMAQVLTAVTFLNEKNEVVTLPVADCALSYRHSVFSEHPEWFILSAELALRPGDREDIRVRMAELSEQRRAKQPLDLPSAGSTFKRPAGHFAAALIDQCGLKGLTVGGARVSEKHAGFVVNAGGATCADILALVDRVKARVLAETGVALELEVKTLGVEK